MSAQDSKRTWQLKVIRHSGGTWTTFTAQEEPPFRVARRIANSGFVKRSSNSANPGLDAFRYVPASDVQSVLILDVTGEVRDPDAKTDT